MKVQHCVISIVSAMALPLALLSVGAQAHTEDDPFVTDLIAGGGNVKSEIYAGEVSIWNDADNLYVQYATTEDWCLISTELQVADALNGIPQNQNANPKIGHFGYKTYHTLDPCITQELYTVSLLDHNLEYLDLAYIAAHAVIQNATTEQNESAWGAGELFNDKNWARYIVYEVQEPAGPTPGEDIVVFNDINPFDQMGTVNPNNPIMIENLVNYTTSSPRGTSDHVWFDRGRDSVCAGTGECNDVNLATMRQVITDAGYTIDNITSASGSITAIPSDVKVVFLWNPLVPYTPEEINAFKAFASEGGRVVFVGEWDEYYGSGIDLENQFLVDMGAVMTNIGEALDCGYTDLPAESLRPHQITTGMTGVRVACASVIVPGEEDYPFLYDSTNTQVLAGVAKIDTTPIEATITAMPETVMQLLSEPQERLDLNPASSTGE